MNNASLQYPPPFAHEESWQFAWEAAHKRTKDLLIEEYRSFQSNLRASTSNNLILQIEELHTENRGEHLGLIAGITNGKRAPLFLQPEQIADVINCTDPADRVQLSRVLFWERIYNLVDDLNIEEELEEGADDEGDEDYGWNGGSNPADALVFQDAPPAIEIDCDQQYDNIISGQPDLKDLYFAILNGRL